MSFKRPDDRPYVIADLGLNHNGDPGTASELIESAARAGADCALVPMYRTNYLLAGTYLPDQVETYRRHELTPDEFTRLGETAYRNDIDLAATVFDRDLLEWYSRTDTDPPFVGLASGDITFKRLLVDAGEGERSIMLGTAGATEEEIQQALDWIQPLQGTLHLCHGTALRPAPSERLHLRRIPWMKERFEQPVGFTDHSETPDAALVASSLGADVWKRSVTLDSTQSGPEHSYSMEFDDFASVIKQLPAAYSHEPEDLTDTAERLIGESCPEWTEEEKEFRINTRRSLMADRPLSAGSLLKTDMIRELRPARGLPADKIDQCVGLQIPRPTDPMTMISY